MGSVDNRIVHMEFDNALFEKGVSQTIQTLDKLDKGLDTLNNAHALDSLQTAADAITKKFSIMGTVGDEIIRRIANDLIDLTKKITVGPLSAALNQIKTGGINRSFNIENARFQLQGLLKDEEKVKAVMNDASESVNDTAYGYDEAAKAASQFAASGLQAGEEMMSALRGITGVAAMTNSDYESISRIFTTVAGNGRMMGDQLLQLSSRGLNAASTIKDFVNGVNDGSIQVSDSVKAVVQEFSTATDITEQDIRDATSDGEISFKLFADAMDSTFGDHAKQANVTFNGALSNMKAALSRIGQKFVQPLIAQSGPIVDLFNALRVQINGINAGLDGVAKWFTDNASAIIKWATKIVESINMTEVMEVVNEHFNSFLNILSAIGAILKPIGQAFKEVFFRNVTIDSFAVSVQRVADAGKEASENFKKFWTESEEGKRYLEEIKNIFSGLFSVIKMVGKTIGNIIYILSPLGRLVKDLFVWLTDILSPLGLILTEADEAYDKSEKVAVAVEVLHDVIDKLVDVIEAVLSPFGDFIGVLSTTKDIGKAWKTAMTDVEPFVDFMENAFNKLTTAIDNAFDKIKIKIDELSKKYPVIGDIVKVFEKLKNVLETIGLILGGVIYQTFTSLAAQMPGILNSIKEFFSNFASSIQQIGFVQTIQNEFSKLSDKVKQTFENNKITVGIETIGTSIKNVGVFDTLSKAVSKLANLLSQLLDKMDIGLNNFYKKHIESKEISNAVSKAGTSVKNSFKGLSGIFDKTSKDSDKFTTKTVTAAESYGAAMQTTVKVATAFNKESEKTAQTSKTATDSISSVFKSIKQGYNSIDPLIKQGIFNIINTILLGQVGKQVNAFSKNGGLLGMLIGNGLNGIGSSLSKIGNSLSSFLGQVQKAVKTWQKNETAKILKSIAMSMLMLAGALAILSQLDWKQLLTGVVTLGSLMAEMALFTKMLAKSGIIKLTKDKNKVESAFSAVGPIGTMMIKMAFSLLLVATAISKIAKVWDKEDPYKLIISVGSIAALMLEIAMVVKIIGNDKDLNEDGLKRVSGLFIAMALAIRTIANGIAIIAIFDPKSLAISLGIMSAILWELVAAIAVIALFNRTIEDEEGKDAVDSDALMQSAKILMAAALALQMIAIPLAMIAKVAEKNPDGLTQAVIDLSIMLGVITGALIAISVTNKAISNSGNTEKDGLRLLGAAGAIVLVAAAIQMIAIPLAALALLPIDKIMQSIFEITLMLGVITVFLAALTAFAKGNITEGISAGFIKGFKKVGNSLIEAAAAILIMAKAIQMIAIPLAALSLIPFSKLAQGFGAMSLMLAAMTGSLMILSLMKGDVLAGAASILIVAAAIDMVTPALLALSLVPFKKLMSGVGSLAILFGSLAALSVGLGAISALAIPGAAALALMAASVDILAVGMVKLAAGIVALVAAAPLATTAFSVMQQAIVALIAGIVKIIPQVVQAIIESFALQIPVITKTTFDFIITMLDMLNQYMPQIIDKAATLIIQVFTLLKGRIGDIVTAVVSFFQELWSAIKIATGLDNTELVLNLIITLAVIAALMAACAALQIIAIPAMKGLLALTVFTAGLTLCIAAIGALSQLPGLKWLIGEGGSILQLVGTAIGQFMGGIVGGFAEGVSATFPQIATDLSNFMTNLQPFIEGAQQIDLKMLEGVNALVETILLLTGAEIIKGIADFLSGGSSLDDFGADIAKLGPHFKDFADSVADVKASTVDKADIAASTIKKLAEAANAIPNSGGLLGKIMGDNDIDGFGAQLASFGKAFVDFSTTIVGIDQNAASNTDLVVSCTKKLADMAKQIPNSGGVTGFFAGDNDLMDFGANLMLYGKAFVDYSHNIVGMDPDVASNTDLVVSASKKLADMAAMIPNSGGIVSWFTGDNNLEDFGNNLSAFGEAFSEFSTSVSGINLDAVNLAVNEFGKIIGLANLASVADTSGFDKFKKAFEKLGTDSINNFVNTFDGASEKVKTAIDKLISTAQNELNSGTSGILKAGTSLGTALSIGIINGIKSNAGALNLTVRSIGVQIALLAKTSLPAATFSSIALTNIIQPLARGITGNQLLVIYAIQILVSQIKITFMAYLSVAWFLTLGYTINQYLAMGMNNGMGLIIAAAISMCSTIRSTFYANLNLYDVGQYAAQGLANGITSKVNDIANAAIAAAKAAVDAAKAKLDEHSPSKVFYQMGQFIDQGLINGIDNYRSKVYDSGTNLGRAVIESMNSSLDKSNGLFDLGIDGNPVIRPVLDLSDIDAKSDKIDSLFDGVNNLAATINLNGTISRAQIAASSFNNAYTNQNGVNNTTPTGNTFNFVQNNYSPKALSRTEIYRQTRNQFSAIQGAMNSV